MVTPKHTAVFCEGNYIYRGTPIFFSEEISIDDVQISFHKIDKRQFEQAQNVNVVKNYFNKKFYEIELTIKLFGSDDYLTYSLIYYGNPGRPDLYDITVTDDNGYEWSLCRVWLWLQDANEQHISQRIELEIIINDNDKIITQTVFLQIEGE